MCIHDVMKPTSIGIGRSPTIGEMILVLFCSQIFMQRENVDRVRKQMKDGLQKEK